MACKKCGECCKYIPIPASGTAMEKEYFTTLELTYEPKQKLWLVFHRCPHLTSENMCNIYETRPKVCKMYKGRKFAKGSTYYVPDGCTMAERK